MKVNVIGGKLSKKELSFYTQRALEKFGDRLIAVDIAVLNESEVNIKYTISTEVHFERIRRITGYLVGTMSKWNDAKRNEERDRVKHGMEG